MNKELLKKVMDQIDAIAAEAADHPPLNEDESISRMINLGRLEAAKDILKTIYKKTR